MQTVTYQFENRDGDQFPERYATLNEAIRDCSDFVTFRSHDAEGWHTREGGVVFVVEAEN